jgi:hypothetical protein
MPSKIKNEPSRYLTRAALAGSFSDPKGNKSPQSTESERTVEEQRDAKGILDRRWYIQLPPKR